LINGNWSDEDFLKVKPGEEISAVYDFDEVKVKIINSLLRENFLIINWNK